MNAPDVVMVCGRSLPLIWTHEGLTIYEVHEIKAQIWRDRQCRWRGFVVYCGTDYHTGPHETVSGVLAEASRELGPRES